jgi:hypothetical protein
MTARFDALSADAVLSDEEDDAPVVAWSLDELDQLSDLDSVRSAWGHTDELVY